MARDEDDEKDDSVSTEERRGLCLLTSRKNRRDPFDPVAVVTWVCVF
jgi:hypothetical protein